MPIVSNDRDWDIGDGKGSLPNGRKDMKLIGFYTIYIVEPDTKSDIGKKKTPMQADVLWVRSRREMRRCDTFPACGFE